MHFTRAGVVALLPTFGVATQFLKGQGNTNKISPDVLKSKGGSLGIPNLATSLMSNKMVSNKMLSNMMSSNGVGSSLPASSQDFPQGDSPQGNGNAGTAPGVNDCGFSNFVQLKEDYGYPQASVEDCMALMDSVANDQEWIITQEIQTIANVASCAFKAVVSRGQGVGLVAALGNSDVIDLTNDTIRQFGDDGYVSCHGGFGMYTSAAGAMPCDSPNLVSGEQVFVDWFITTPDGMSGGDEDGMEDGDNMSGATDDSDGGSHEAPPNYVSHHTEAPPSYDPQGHNDDGSHSSPPSYDPQGHNDDGSHFSPPSYAQQSSNNDDPSDAPSYGKQSSGGGERRRFMGRRAMRAVKL